MEAFHWSVHKNTKSLRIDGKIREINSLEPAYPYMVTIRYFSYIEKADRPRSQLLTFEEEDSRWQQSCPREEVWEQPQGGRAPDCLPTWSQSLHLDKQ